MLFLALAVLCSASLPLLFRAFDEWRVDVFWAIPANYLTCVVLGSLLAGNPFGYLKIHAEPWVAFSFFQGLFLAGNFFLLAFTAQRAGVSVAALASRLAVAIPVLLGFLLYGDELSALKIFGLAIAGLSLLLTTTGGEVTRALMSARHKLLPWIVFTSFGLYLSLLKFVQAFYLNDASYHSYVTLSFLFAFLASCVAVARVQKPSGARFRNLDLFWGTILGAINYAAVYFLVRVLSIEGWESSQIFPTYAVSALLVSSVMAFLLFGERLSRVKQLGLLAGVAAVALLNQ